MNTLSHLLPAPNRLLPALRRLLSALWRRATGRTAEGGRPTAAFLRRRMLVLPALAVVALALSAAAYSDVHNRTERLRDRCAPALVDLAEARVSLELAQAQATLRLTGKRHAGRVELGETYRSLLTEASQSLNRVAQSRALHKAQEQELRVVSGLVVAYDDKLAWAARHTDKGEENEGRTKEGEESARATNKLLREAGVEYAAGILGSPKPTGTAAEATSQEPTAILDRIAELERQLHQETGDLAAWSPLTLAAAAAAALAAALFAFVLVGTCLFLRDRLRLISLQLVVASVPVLLTPVLLAVGGAQEHDAQERVRTTVSTLEQGPAHRDALRRIESTALDADAAMRAAHPDGWSLTAGVTVPAGGAGAVACGLTLFFYVRPYPAGRTIRKYGDA
jgi:hypothetical protein